MASSSGAERRARMQRKLNALTLAVGLTGATATGALMTVAHAQPTTPSTSAVRGVTNPGTSPAAAGTDPLVPAPQPVAVTRQAPAATSGAS